MNDQAWAKFFCSYAGLTQGNSVALQWRHTFAEPWRNCCATGAQQRRHRRITNSVGDTLPERIYMFALIRQHFLQSVRNMLLRNSDATAR